MELGHLILLQGGELIPGQALGNCVGLGTCHWGEGAQKGQELGLEPAPNRGPQGAPRAALEAVHPPC